MIETGEAEEPVGWYQVFWTTLYQVAGHHHLVAVEDDPGDVTEAEDQDDTDDDQGTVDLTHDIHPAAAVGIS